MVWEESGITVREKIVGGPSIVVWELALWSGRRVKGDEREREREKRH